MLNKITYLLTYLSQIRMLIGRKLPTIIPEAGSGNVLTRSTLYDRQIETKKDSLTGPVVTTNGQDSPPR